MKKFIPILLFCLSFTLLFGCGAETFRTVRNDDGEHILVLPDAPNNVEIVVHDEHLNSLSQIDRELFDAAYEELLAEIKPDSDVEAWLALDSTDSCLHLNAEIITAIDPPRVSEFGDSSGCGIDHEHDTVSYVISAKPIEIKP